MIVGTNPFAALMGGSPAPQAGAPAAVGFAGAADFASAFGTILGTPALSGAPSATPSLAVAAPQPQPGSAAPLADVTLLAGEPAGAVVQTSSPFVTPDLFLSEPLASTPLGPIATAPLEGDFPGVANAAAVHLAESTPENGGSAAKLVTPTALEGDRPSLPAQVSAPATAASLQPSLVPAQPAAPSPIAAAAPQESAEPDADAGADESIERDTVVDVGTVEIHTLSDEAPAMAPALSRSAPATVLEDDVAATPEPSISRSGPVIETGATREPAAPQASQPGFAERLTASLAASPAPPTPGSEAATPASPAPVSGAPAIASAEPAAPPGADIPTITARPGRIGQEMGVEIARRLSAGGEELTVRLNPAEMGRIEVRLSFDERGSLRAVVAAESTAALEMLRRDSADLGRTLTDAGVRADAQSFRFDGRSGDGAAGQFWQRQQSGGDRRRAFGQAASDAAAEAAPIHRRLGTSGRVDLMA